MRSSIPEINYTGAEIVELTQELLKEWVHYDPETGIFTWKKHRQPYMVGSAAYQKAKSKLLPA